MAGLPLEVDRALSLLVIDDKLPQTRRFGIARLESSIHQMLTRIRGNRITQSGAPGSPDSGIAPGAAAGAGIALLGASAADSAIEIVGNYVLAHDSGILAALGGLSVLDNEEHGLEELEGVIHRGDGPSFARPLHGEVQPSTRGCPSGPAVRREVEALWGAKM